MHFKLYNLIWSIVVLRLPSFEDMNLIVLLLICSERKRGFTSWVSYILWSWKIETRLDLQTRPVFSRAETGSSLTVDEK